MISSLTFFFEAILPTQNLAFYLNCVLKYYVFLCLYFLENFLLFCYEECWYQNIRIVTET